VGKVKGARYLFALALLLIPIEHGTKVNLNLKFWIDPTLVLSLIILVLYGIRPRPLATWVLVAFSFVCAYVGAVVFPPPGSDLKALNRILEEPIRLALMMAFFWVCVHFFQEHRSFALKWLSISALLQFLTAVVLYMVLLTWIPVPNRVADMIEHYYGQVVYVGDIKVLRMCGTFTESPLFGSFMFSVLVLLWLAVYREQLNPGYSRLAIVAALLGSAASLSGQILLGLLPFLGGSILGLRRLKVLPRILLFLIICLPAPFVTEQIMIRKQEAEVLGTQEEISGTSSGGERAWHALFAWDLFKKSPHLWITGFGPGRYGGYAAETRLFPDTVYPAMAPVEWMFGYGLGGILLVLAWLWVVVKSAAKTYGAVFGITAFTALMLANLFQVNWISESWFMALAYLYAKATQRGQDTRREQKRLSVDLRVQPRNWASHVRTG
jgi:hypothetical protein